MATKVDETKTADEGKRIYVSYNDEWYDITEFDHPGEGIRGTYMSDYNGKKIDEELHTAHSTNDPYEWLEEAKAKGECDGVRFIGELSKAAE